MAIDPPSRIAILGAGPVGLEAALYARYLGYDVTVYERGSAADNVRQWGHVVMFTPFAMNCSTLGRAAIEAQSPGYRFPPEDQLTTGAQWIEAYLKPLAETDLVADTLRLHTTVESVGRAGLLKTEAPGSSARGEVPFQILLHDTNNKQSWDMAHIVLDTTGTYGNHNWVGPGGISAIGETTCAAHIEYNVPDVQHTAQEHYHGQHTLLIGSGYSAATSAVALAELARNASDSCVTWITRPRWNPPSADGPIREIANDRLTQRHRLAVKANQLSQQTNRLQYWPDTTLVAMSRDDAKGQFEVVLEGQHKGRHAFDRIVANVGYRPNRNIYRELQVHECYASEGPMQLAAALSTVTSDDCLNQPDQGPETLLNPEPNFFILGSKSHGRGTQALFQSGLTQIRDVFSIIQGRHDLDLYNSA